MSDRRASRRGSAERGSTTERGYGTAHQKLRARWAPQVARGDIECARCGELIDPDEPWDLGHDDTDRSVYSGPEHQDCNRGRRARAHAGTAPRWQSRRW